MDLAVRHRMPAILQTAQGSAELLESAKLAVVSARSRKDPKYSFMPSGKRTQWPANGFPVPLGFALLRL